MTLTTTKSVISTMLALGLLISAMPLMADTAAPAAAPNANHQHWRKTHPARVKDNERIHNQKKQLKADLASGKITKDQYNAQMKDLNTIHKEENVDAKANENGGHLTAGQQQAINQQLNDSHQDIKQDVKNDQVAK